MKRRARHNVFQEAHRSFVVFYDQPLTWEPVTDEDLTPVEIRPGWWGASAAWSANCDWYFVVRPTDILLLNTYTNRGLRCRKKSARFIELFLETPVKPRRAPRPGRMSVDSKRIFSGKRGEVI